MTPVTALEPYRALWGPRVTSTRSIPSAGRDAMSIPPPKSFIATPSTITALYLDSPPRMNTPVTPPRRPLWLTSTPGMPRRLS